ncbi:hypothetical protein D4R89_11120 [bacterium]|nr:MAG: hypothetical protein D4R89_11120 [bacterium]
MSAFEDTEALRRYLTQSDHIVVGKTIRGLCASLQIVDFEY